MEVATAMGISASTVYKWRRRYRTEGLAGLRDRSSRPNASPARTPGDVEAKVIALVSGRTLKEAAAEIGVTEGTARTTLKRVFVKTGTHSQADLIRRAAAKAFPSGDFAATMRPCKRKAPSPPAIPRPPPPPPPS